MIGFGFHKPSGSIGSKTLQPNSSDFPGLEVPETYLTEMRHGGTATAGRTTATRALYQNDTWTEPQQR